MTSKQIEKMEIKAEYELAYEKYLEKLHLKVRSLNTYEDVVPFSYKRFVRMLQYMDIDDIIVCSVWENV